MSIDVFFKVEGDKRNKLMGWPSNQSRNQGLKSTFGITLHDRNTLHQSTSFVRFAAHSLLARLALQKKTPSTSLYPPPWSIKTCLNGKQDVWTSPCRCFVCFKAIIFLGFQDLGGFSTSCAFELHLWRSNLVTWALFVFWGGDGMDLYMGGFLKWWYQQPLVFLLKLIILWCFGGTTI